ncbi:MAG: reverse transcriptase family protein [Oscillospiraceae bacterium]
MNELKEPSYSIGVLNVNRSIVATSRQRPRVLVKLQREMFVNKSGSEPPSVYTVNAGSLAKPHAFQHLMADIEVLQPDVVIVVESWLTKTHDSELFKIPDYVLFRRDRCHQKENGRFRRGGGIAAYVKTKYNATIFKPLVERIDEGILELLWVTFQKEANTCFIGGIYHPPNPSYEANILVNFIEAAMEEIDNSHPNSLICLTGDFNQLSDSSIQSLGFIREITPPTRGNNCLDRFYINRPVYEKITVLNSTVKTDHKALFAYSGNIVVPCVKINKQHTFRLCLPKLNAAFLYYVNNFNTNYIHDSVYIDVHAPCIQPAFDRFYSVVMDLLDHFYPLKTVTLSDRDPPFITPRIKYMLRVKNRLMRKGRVEEANAISKRIQSEITVNNTSSFNNISSVKDLWSKVRSLTGKVKGVSKSDDPLIDAESLNTHYSRVSTDSDYRPPLLKSTVGRPSAYVTEVQVLGLLEKLKPTSPGLDGVPAWFLRIAAGILAKPISILFNLSLSWSEVPRQWKTSVITPVAKVRRPETCSDYRPISVTPILSRVLEKLVVKNFIYPIFTSPRFSHLFMDQYAFRPTGSTTSALISMLHILANLLQSYPYVHLIALDFSKAFDTVRHFTLLQKFSDMMHDDCVYNWLVRFLEGRDHCTKYDGEISSSKFINASIVQGSGLGPASYVVAASDLQPLFKDDSLNKYADDSYLMVPSVNSKLIPEELTHISKWAACNNLNLNTSKTKEMIVRRRRTKLLDIPPPLAGITRVETMNVLGVTLQCDLSFQEQVVTLVNQCAQNLYALRMLRSHGLNGQQLWDVTRATLVARISYASQAWWGLLDSEGRSRLEAAFKKVVKQGFLPPNQMLLSDICYNADATLFSSVLHNPHHVLHHLLPPVKATKYNMRPRAHDREISVEINTLYRKTFFIKMLNLDSY